MAEVEECWELPITVPPVTEEVHTLTVLCGKTSVEVSGADGRPELWHVHQRGYALIAECSGYDQAVAEAREWVVAEERRRLLWEAVDAALQADAAEGGGPRD